MNLNALINEFGTAQSFEKSAHIFMQEQTNNNIYFIRSGILKAYYINTDGKEFIKSFIFVNDIIGSMQALQGGLTSYNLQCIKATQVTKLAYKHIRDRCKENISLANEVIELLSALAIKKERREFELLCLPAEQRYLQLLKKIPNIYDYVTQNDIARYLGITPVALSRIKHNSSIEALAIHS